MKWFIKNERKIKPKNYYIVLIVSIVVIALCLYVRSLYLNYQASKGDTSVFFDKSINQINIEDIDYAIGEASDAILFVSFNGDKAIASMERRLYREVVKFELNDKFLYLNVNDYLDKNEYIGILKNKFPEKANDINRGPMFIYIKDGECEEVIDSSKNLVNYKILDSLLLKYGIE